MAVLPLDVAPVGGSLGRGPVLRRPIRRAVSSSSSVPWSAVLVTHYTVRHSQRRRCRRGVGRCPALRGTVHSSHRPPAVPSPSAEEAAPGHTSQRAPVAAQCCRTSGSARPRSRRPARRWPPARPGSPTPRRGPAGARSRRQRRPPAGEPSCPGSPGRTRALRAGGPPERSGRAHVKSAGTHTAGGDYHMMSNTTALGL